MAVPWQALLTVAVLAVTFTGIAAYRLARERWLRRGGVKVRALVTGQDQHYGYGSDRGLVQSPIIRFDTLDGRTVHTRLPVSSNMSTATPGRVMTVYYNPNRPDEVAMVGYGLGTIRVFLLIGILLCGVTAALLFAPAQTLAAAVPFFVPIVLGSAFLGIGGYGVGRIWIVRMRGGHADGVVVGETSSSTREGLPMHHPVVSFRTTNGFEIQTAAERGRTLRRVRQGQAVRVRYHPDDPYRMVLAGDGARPVFYLFALIGLLILVGTAAVLVRLAWP